LTERRAPKSLSPREDFIIQHPPTQIQFPLLFSP
jgi:hypothetical protein